MWKQIRTPLAVAAASAAAIAAAVAIGPDTAPRPAAAAGPAAPQPVQRVIGDGLAALPSDSLSDWTSYSDYVVDAVATQVTRGQPTAAEVQAGEGLAVRLVTLKISRVLWSAPGAHARPDSLVIADGGWLFSPGKPERELVAGDAARLEAGHHYLMPIFYDETFHPAWQGLYPSTFLPFDGGVVGRGETLYGADLQPVDAAKAARDPRQSRRTLWGESADGVVASLAAAKPDERARAHADLPPSARYQAAIKK